MTTAPARPPSVESARRHTLRTAWSHGSGKDLVADPGRPLTEIRRQPAENPETVLARAGADSRWTYAVARALREALSPTRWDDWSAYNAHRPFPSARAKQAHQVSIRTPSGALVVDEVRVELAPGPGPSGPHALVVHPEPARIPEGYGALRSAIALLETGHVVGELAHRLSQSGCRTRVRLVAGRDADRPAIVLEPIAWVASRRPTPIARRCSGLDVRGLRADPRPLPAASLDRLLAAPRPVGDGLRHRLAVSRVEGRIDGVWEATSGAIHLVAAGQVGDRIDAAVRGPRGVINAASMNLLWGLSANLTRAPDLGPASYAAVLVSAGASAQAICRGAAAAGLFARPIRGIDEPDAEAALVLPTGEDLVYFLLIGRPVVHGFTYDLSPCWGTEKDKEPS